MEYYISIDNEQRGPYSMEELAARKITAETLVMAVDGTQWIPAWQVEELRPVITQQTAAEANGVQPEVEAEPGAVQPEVPYIHAQPLEASKQSSPQPRKPKKSYAGCLLGLLVAIIVAAVFVFTCPDEQAHKTKIVQIVTEVVTEVAEKNSKDNDFLSQSVRVMGNMFIGKMVDAAVDGMVTVDNYAVCSIGRVKYGGKERIVSVGLLGHVFTGSKEQMSGLAEKYYLDIQSKAEDAVKNQLQQSLIGPIKSMVGDLLDDVISGISPDDDTAESPDDSTEPQAEN